MTIHAVPVRPRLFEHDSLQAHELRAPLAAGLLAANAAIAPKFFYDPLGSALFAAICELPEYYPTRTEAAIVGQSLAGIAAAIGPDAVLVDLGAGDCTKAARLFDAVRPAQYVALDISSAFVARALEHLQREHPALDLIGVGLDFTQSMWLPEAVRGERRVFLYPGSSIGNFAPAEAVAFLRRVRAWTDPRGGLLLGVDLAKPRAIVEPAYDDALGVTAAFNLNVLNHVNRLLGSDFDVAHWRHVAFLDEDRSRIEMHLEARRALTVRWPGAAREFAAGERIHTEHSYKWRLPEVEAMLLDAGFEPQTTWTDARGWFALVHARPAG
jgi:dimethylhistidine N-methyltransferase